MQDTKVKKKKKRLNGHSFYFIVFLTLKDVEGIFLELKYCRDKCSFICFTYSLWNFNVINICLKRLWEQTLVDFFFFFITTQRILDLILPPCGNWEVLPLNLESWDQSQYNAKLWTRLYTQHPHISVGYKHA